MKLSDAMQDVLDGMTMEDLYPYQIQHILRFSKGVELSTKKISSCLQALKKKGLVTHCKRIYPGCGYAWNKAPQHPCSGKCPRYNQEACGTCLVGEGA